MKKMQEKSRPQSKSSKESAEQFFRRLRQERIEKEKSEPEVIYEATPVTQNTLAEELMENKVVQPETSIKKKRKKMVIDFKDKNKVQKAYIMKAILDRPQAYKF